MKKVLILLIAGMLSATSCTEHFEPSVDYGEQTYINDYSALVTAINDLNKSISERFEALNKLLEKNMAEIKLAIDENTGAIKVLSESVTDGLSAINATLFDGFSALTVQIDEVGNRIVYAINENGELLRLQIDETGKLISAEIQKSAEALVEVINSQTATIGEKFDALTAMVKTGFADVTAKIGEVGEQLHLDIQGVNTTLGTLNTTMTDGFTTLGTKIDANGNTIATAINEQGDKLELAIDNNGKVVSAEIKDFKGAYETAAAAELAKMGEVLGAINDLKDANNTNAANQMELLKKLEKLLSDNGIYPDENNRQQMYMTPENYAAVQDAGVNSALYKLYADQLDVLAVTFNNKQVVDAAGNIHTHAIYTPNTAADAAPVLVASRAEVVDGVANGKKVVKVVKTAVDRNYTVTIDAGCNTRYIFGVRLTDAKNTNVVSTFTPTLTYNLKLTIYDKSTGVIQNNINATVYCNNGGAPYDITNL